MRRKHPTSHNKLSVVFVLLLMSFTLSAKDEAEDTNIICFAAKNQWVCAPEGQQQIANEKANKLIGNNSEQETSQVVIRPINFPKFDSDKHTTNIFNEDKETELLNKPDTIVEVPNTQSSIHISTETNTTSSLQDNKLQSIPNSNPYAKMWSHQLIGVSTPQNAINFVKKHNLDKEKILVIKSKRNNMDWWIVLFGLYKDKQTGLENEPNLPKNITDQWLRPLKNLQVTGFIEKF